MARKKDENNTEEQAEQQPAPNEQTEPQKGEPTPPEEVKDRAEELTEVQQSGAGEATTEGKVVSVDSERTPNDRVKVTIAKGQEIMIHRQNTFGVEEGTYHEGDELEMTRREAVAWRDKGRVEFDQDQ